MCTPMQQPSPFLQALHVDLGVVLQALDRAHQVDSQLNVVVGERARHPVNEHHQAVQRVVDRSHSRGSCVLTGLLRDGGDRGLTHVPHQEVADAVLHPQASVGTALRQRREPVVTRHGDIMGRADAHAKTAPRRRAREHSAVSRVHDTPMSRAAHRSVVNSRGRRVGPAHRGRIPTNEGAEHAGARRGAAARRVLPSRSRSAGQPPECRAPSLSLSRTGARPRPCRRLPGGRRPAHRWSGGSSAPCCGTA